MTYPVASSLSDIGDRFAIIAHRVPFGLYTDTWEPTVGEDDWAKLRRGGAVVTAQARVDGKFVLLARATAQVSKTPRQPRRMMTDSDRERILALYRSGVSFPDIAAQVERHQGTVESVVYAARTAGLVGYRYAGCADARP